MTTIKDIAEYVGVSATTVSNVIHGRKNRVSEDTVARIQDAIKELNYVPNMFARSLASSSSRVVAFVNLIPTRADATFSDDTFQMSFLSTLESILRENGYFLMFRRVETTEELRMFLQNWNVDGIFVGGICDRDFAEILSELTIPTIVIDTLAYVKEDTCKVGLDDENGGYLATSHLIDMGHRRIAFTTSPMHDGYVMKGRFTGYKKALAERGVTYDSGLIFECDVDLKTTIKLAKTLAKISGLTAVFASTDIMAAGIMTGFHDLGIDVPGDISIVGFDDVALSRMTMPPLTTIRQDMLAKARAAGENMVKMLMGDKAAKRDIILPVELIKRKSVADINGRLDQ